jgi:hypothetical protein
MGLHKDSSPDHKAIGEERLYKESPKLSEAGEEAPVSDKQHEEERSEEGVV